jgi:hypothetical protein
MVSFIISSIGRGEQIRNDEEEELWHVKDIKELGTISDIEPHPVSIGLESDTLKSEEL